MEDERRVECCEEHCTHDGVTKATVSFMAQKLTLEADDERFDEIVKEVVKCVRRWSRTARSR